MTAVRLLLAGALLASLLAAEDWPRFRGPNGSGVADGAALPDAIGPETNVVWRVALPEGHSSPIVVGQRIYLTGAEGGERTDAGRQKVVDAGGKLFTYAIDPHNGEILWKRQAPRPRMERYQPTNSAASPTPTADADGVYVFFGDYGLISYSHQGEERWRLPLGPFNNVNGHGSSPIVVGGLAVLVCDSDDDAYLLAVDKDSGKIVWKTPRPETTRTYVTPALYEPAGEDAQLIVPGAYFLGAYSARTGEKLWWVRRGGWQPKSTPVVAHGRVYVNSWEGGGGSPEADIASFEELLSRADSDGDGLVSETEMKTAEPRMRYETTDLDHDAQVDRRDWDFYRARKSSRPVLVAIRPDGRGDLTETGHVEWSLERFLPNVPSPLVYRGVMYLVKDGGILTALDPATGEIHEQGRLADALDKYYASPVAADGKLYLFSESGKGTVVSAGRDWRILSTSNFGADVYATPAIAGDRIYVRTRDALYAFGRSGQ